MVANWVYWRRVSRASKWIFVTIKSTIDAMKFSNTVQLSPLFIKLPKKDQRLSCQYELPEHVCRSGNGCLRETFEGRYSFELPDQVCRSWNGC
jgi:hypothetical protein